MWVAVWHGLISICRDAVLPVCLAYLYLSADEGFIIKFLGTIEHLFGHLVLR